MTIGEVSERFGLSVDTLRYYEKIGLIPPVCKNNSGKRDYTENDCRWVEFAICMRSTGLPLDSIIQYVRMYQMGDETLAERVELLKEHRCRVAERVDELTSTIKRLDDKIKRYEEGNS